MLSYSSDIRGEDLCVHNKHNIYYSCDPDDTSPPFISLVLIDSLSVFQLVLVGDQQYGER